MKERVFGLDVMRCVAILMVLFCHSLWLIEEVNFTGRGFIQSLGFFGVELFFILSGFLIGNILWNWFDTDVSYKRLFHFYARRWLRTLPLYYIVLLINVGLALYFGNIIPDTIHQYFFFIHNWWHKMPDFFNESWSLSVEESIYLIVPFLLLSLKKIFPAIPYQKIFLYTTLSIILMAFVNRFYALMNLPQSASYIWNLDVKSVVLYRLDAIIYGFLILFVYKNFITFLDKYRVLLFIFSFFLYQITKAIIYTQLGFEAFYVVFYLPLVSICIALMVPFFYQLKPLSFPLFNQGITLISKISYSIYLWHYSIIIMIWKYLIYPNVVFNYMNSLIHVLLYFLITFLVSYFSYQYIEKPFLRLRK